MSRKPIHRDAGGAKRLLLLHPPVAKACEAPGGLVRLAGALRRRGILCRLWDANLEGQLALLASAERTCRESEDTWTRRAARRLQEHCDSLRSWEVYANPDRYRRAAASVNRLLAAAAEPFGVRLGLADYEADSLSPVRSADLLKSAGAPENNPFHAWFRQRFAEIFDEAMVSHVGFSINYLSQALSAFAMIGVIKREYPFLRIIIGGGLVTSWMRGPGWRNPFPGLVDEAICGPGEEPLLAAMGKCGDGSHDRPDLAGFPLGGYLAPGVVLPYSASAGCWWRRCSFCPEPAEGNPYRPLPLERVAEDLRVLTAQVKPALIHFLDNALSPPLLKTLAEDPPGAPWYGFARVTSHLADPTFCRRLKESGCVMLKLGLESGDQGVLDALNKGIDLRRSAEVLTRLQEAGIATYVYLLFGTPAETQTAAIRTREFIAAHRDRIGFLNLAVFNLPAYGPETEGLETGEFYAGDLSLYRPFVHPQGWNRRAVKRFLDKEFRKKPCIAEILRRTPPFFTSNHAPFFVMASPFSSSPASIPAAL
ncbi:MAG: radical SAM protein [Deltaproteobacteria bacterium]|nr:radical SAM protein [Deltaproteobacteria bacterium]